MHAVPAHAGDDQLWYFAPEFKFNNRFNILGAVGGFAWMPRMQPLPPARRYKFFGATANGTRNGKLLTEGGARAHQLILSVVSPNPPAASTYGGRFLWGITTPRRLPAWTFHRAMMATANRSSSLLATERRRKCGGRELRLGGGSPYWIRSNITGQGVNRCLTTRGRAIRSYSGIVPTTYPGLGAKR
jgi:hypothetical protein